MKVRAAWEKIIDRAEVVERLGPGRPFRLVFTNGCFDLLHPGHIDCLERARGLGDALLVAVNTDRSVRRLGKGEGRPFVDHDARATMVAALGCVDWVTLFDEETPERLIAEVRPDVLVKGGDYSEEEVAGVEVVRGGGGEVVIVPLVPGYSTSALVRRIREGR
ncbi:MAG: D-glycero-beta-D-manno-heptose 1-phosphate adenylyltransferase [Gemmatimonadota bacterium]|nr:D-glycero-beta-D-manno-heptose 1-phosphate adenylyltransferase [Gemmatimonadota bacterium]